MRKIDQCRICGNKNLLPIINLGNHSLTGVFPKTKHEIISKGILELVKCSENGCGLIQTHHSFNLDEMYGTNYGYRSGLNKSMINHLESIVKKIQTIVEIKSNDIIVDIGSNDGTLLSFYPQECTNLVGIDPTSFKFKQYYEKRVNIITDFFTKETYKKNYKEQKAKVITSIAMFYDLENPNEFLKDIYDVLNNDGVWIFEQSYAPLMIDNISYDTICHEHLEYYCLKQIKYMTDKADLKIIDVEFIDANGGSFRITVAKNNSKYKECTTLIQDIFLKEKKYDSPDTLKEFTASTEKHKADFLKLLKDLKSNGKKVLGYGASTKGNVILQYCEINTDLIPYIAEVNEDKFGSFTPGTLIPIISEKEAKDMNPDYLIVFPWHFKKNIIEREKDFLAKGGKLIFPLPKIEIIG
jgi:hypothetical protein